MTDERDSGYWGAEHDEARSAIHRGTYMSDTQRALCGLATSELEAISAATVNGTVADKAFQVFTLLPVLESRYGRE